MHLNVRKKASKKESMVLSNNALYNAYIFDADYHLFMISDIKPSSKQKKPTGMACHKYN